MFQTPGAQSVMDTKNQEMQPAAVRTRTCSVASQELAEQQLRRNGPPALGYTRVAGGGIREKIPTMLSIAQLHTSWWAGPCSRSLKLWGSAGLPGGRQRFLVGSGFQINGLNALRC